MNRYVSIASMVRFSARQPPTVSLFRRESKSSSALSRVEPRRQRSTHVEVDDPEHYEHSKIAADLAEQVPVLTFQLGSRGLGLHLQVRNRAPDEAVGERKVVEDHKVVVGSSARPHPLLALHEKRALLLAAIAVRVNVFGPLVGERRTRLLFAIRFSAASLSLVAAASLGRKKNLFACSL